MISEVQSLIDQYWSWLNEKTRLREINDCIEITTPYLDRHNDYLQIYAKRENDSFVLTDDGYILNDLELSGCELKNSKRIKLLQTVLNGFGVKRNNNSLEIKTSAANFALSKHNLVQTMLAVNDLFYTVSSPNASLFLEEVDSWLNHCDIRYIPKVKFTGKSGFDHFFDFVIPKSKEYPERVLRAINHPDRNGAQTVIFAWTDTREERNPEARAYAILNDTERTTSDQVLAAVEKYEVYPVKWSERDRVKAELAA